MQTLQSVGAVLHGQAHCAVGTIAQGHYSFLWHGALSWLRLSRTLTPAARQPPLQPSERWAGPLLGGAKAFLSQVPRLRTELPVYSLLN